MDLVVLHNSKFLDFNKFAAEKDSIKEVCFLKDNFYPVARIRNVDNVEQGYQMTQHILENWEDQAYGNPDFIVLPRLDGLGHRSTSVGDVVEVYDGDELVDCQVIMPCGYKSATFLVSAQEILDAINENKLSQFFERDLISTLGRAILMGEIKE